MIDLANDLNPLGEGREVVYDLEQFARRGRRFGTKDLFHRISVPDNLVNVATKSHAPSHAQSHTVRVDHLPQDFRADIDPRTVGARSGLFWSGQGRVLAGVGELCRIPLKRRGGFVDAQTQLSALTGYDEVARPGSGPVAFAALDFDPSTDGELIVPEFVVSTSPDGQQWITTYNVDSTTGDTAEALIQRLLAHPGVKQQAAGPEPTALHLRSTLRPEVWRDEIVGRGRALIRDGELDKCVLARELTVTADAPFDPTVILARLTRTFPTANIFFVDGFFGASPELLIGRRSDVVHAHPLAGTAPRSTNPDNDRALALELMSSDKNRWEHQITIDWLLDNLLPFCSYVDAEPQPSIVSLANVHHLGTKVEGRLSSPSASVLELIDALHPTPAVGGDPQKAAIDLIAEIERSDRGRYAGPTGWVDGNGNGEFAVAIRSAQFERPDAVRLFAGVGVVAGSDLQAELDETRSKFQAILGALIQP